MNVLKCQHHVCLNNEPKSWLSVSSGDRQSIKGHHPKYNSYTDLLSVLILLCFVVNCWLILNVPVNNFSVMLGRSHRFLGITSTFGE